MGHRILKERFAGEGGVPKDLLELEKELEEYVRLRVRVRLSLARCSLTLTPLTLTLTLPPPLAGTSRRWNSGASTTIKSTTSTCHTARICACAYLCLSVPLWQGLRHLSLLRPPPPARLTHSPIPLAQPPSRRYTFFHGLLIIAAASIPSILLNAPVGIAAKWWAEKQQVKALAKSRVKIAATDVLLSNKISFTIVAVPALWISYFVLLLLFSGWETKTAVLLFLLCPLLSYVSGMRAFPTSFGSYFLWMPPLTLTTPHAPLKP